MLRKKLWFETVVFDMSHAHVENPSKSIKSFPACICINVDAPFYIIRGSKIIGQLLVFLCQCTTCACISVSVYVCISVSCELLFVCVCKCVPWLFKHSRIHTHTHKRARSTLYAVDVLNLFTPIRFGISLFSVKCAILAV